MEVEVNEDDLLYCLSQSQEEEELSSELSELSSELPSEDALEKEVYDERLIVEKKSLLKLFEVCSTVGCGSLVDSEEIKFVKVGGAFKVKTTCLNNHVNHFASSSSIGDGKEKIFVINILLAAYMLFCGLNFSRVAELFKHLNIACFGKTFFYKIQSEMLQPIVWICWSYMQVLYSLSNSSK